jgi:hypothetical protein
MIIFSACRQKMPVLQLDAKEGPRRFLLHGMSGLMQ